MNGAELEVDRSYRFRPPGEAQQERGDADQDREEEERDGGALGQGTAVDAAEEAQLARTWVE